MCRHAYDEKCPELSLDYEIHHDYLLLWVSFT